MNKRTIKLFLLPICQMDASTRVILNSTVEKWFNMVKGFSLMMMALSTKEVGLMVCSMDKERKIIKN